jgi:hypothetical protein
MLTARAIATSAPAEATAELRDEPLTSNSRLMNLWRVGAAASSDRDHGL